MYLGCSGFKTKTLFYVCLINDKHELRVGLCMPGYVRACVCTCLRTIIADKKVSERCGIG